MAKSKSTSGFVYIWYDRHHKRYYIGSHWGSPDDGYICSSTWMRVSYKRRPQDFKRRIIATITTSRLDLLTEEERWLSMIKPHEIKVRYYNVTIKAKHHWYADRDRSLSVGQRISMANMGRDANFSDPVARGHAIAAGKKKAFDKRRAETGSAFTSEHRENMGKVRKGKKQSAETVAKRSDSLKTAWSPDGVRGGQRAALPDRDTLHSLYIDQKRSLDEIAAEYGCSRPSVSRAIQSHGIALRDGTSKSYIVTFPDGHEEIIHNLRQFVAARPGLIQINMVRSVSKGFRARLATTEEIAT